jgi:hypothetical protein
MGIFRRLGFQLRAQFARRRVERDMEREMAFHVEMETARLVREGQSLDEARRRPRLPSAADSAFAKKGATSFAAAASKI